MALTSISCPHCKSPVRVADQQPPAVCPSCGAPLSHALPTSEEAHWFYTQGRQKLGPVTWQQLRQLATTGKLMPGDMLLQGGTQKWTPGQTIAGLFIAEQPAETCSAIQQPEHATVSEIQAASDQKPLPTIAYYDAASSASKTEAILPRVPGYEILGILGKGGMGVVYKARQQKLKRLVALKMILSGAHADEADLARFRTEAEAVARLQHPNIVQIHEIGEHEGRPYFSLEYVDGGSLAQKLAGTPLPAREAAQLLEPMARAMHAAHERGIIHRDLKPANVLLTQDGQPKITDFGLAKQLDTEVGQTRTGAVMGTPSYMAPEQAMGKVRELGPAADIYALGATLYEMLTGRPPFKGASSMDTLFMVVSEEPVAPSRLNPKVPRDLETVCLKCLEKQESNRYRSAVDLAAEVQRFLLGEPVVARPASRFERTWRWCWRNPTQAAAVGFGTLAILALIVIAGGGILLREKASAALRLQQEKTAAELERDRADQATQRAEREYQRAETYLTQAAIDRAHQLCAEGETGQGLLWLARGLQHAEHTQDVQRQQGIRTLIAAWAVETHKIKATFPSVAVATNLTSPIASRFSGPECFSRDGKLLWLSPDYQTIQLYNSATGLPVGKPLRFDVRIEEARISPNGKSMLVVYRDQTARLWDLTTQPFDSKPLPKPTNSSMSGIITAAGFTPDGSSLFLACGNTVQLWNTETGQPQGATLQLRYSARDFSGAISRDSKSMLITTPNGVHLQEIATGKVVGQPVRLPSDFKGPPLHGAIFTPDGERILTLSQRSLQLWDATTGQTIGQPIERTTQPHTSRFSPDGKLFFALDLRDRTGRLWETGSGKAVGSPFAHHPARLPTFSLDSKRMLAVTPENHLVYWRIDVDGMVSHALPSFVNAPNAPAIHTFSNDGNLVLLGVDDAGRLWDVNTHRWLGQPLAHHGITRLVAIRPDGKAALVSGNGIARLWEIARGGIMDECFNHAAAVQSLAFCKDGKRLLTTTSDGIAQMWALDTGKLALSVPHQDPIHAAHLSPNGRILLVVERTGRSSSDPATLWLRDSATGAALGPPLLKNASISHHSFSRDGRHLLTVEKNASVTLWDTATGKPLGPPLLSGRNAEAQFSSNGAIVLTLHGQTPRTLCLWDTATGKLLLELSSVSRAQLSPDGSCLLTASDSGREQSVTVQLRDCRTGKVRGQPSQVGDVVYMLFSPDSRVALVTGGASVFQWDTATGLPLQSHNIGVVGPPTMGPDGKTILAHNTLRSAKLWDAATWKIIAQFEHQATISSVAYSPDGKSILTTTVAGTAHLWDVATGKALGSPMTIQGKDAKESRQVVAAFAPDGKSVWGVASGNRVLHWKVPTPMRGKPKQLESWAQVVTGMELAGNDHFQPLTLEIWQQRRQEVAECGMLLP